jgi:hypothetical protein
MNVSDSPASFRTEGVVFGETWKDDGLIMNSPKTLEVVVDVVLLRGGVLDLVEAPLARRVKPICLFATEVSMVDGSRRTERCECGWKRVV